MRRLDSEVIDIDFYKENNNMGKLGVLKLLFDLKRCCKDVKVRKSSSGNGIHISYRGAERFMIEYSDRKKLGLDRKRKELGLENNFLFDRKGKKKSDEWVEIENTRDMLRFCRRVKGKCKSG